MRSLSEKRPSLDREEAEPRGGAAKGRSGRGAGQEEGAGESHPAQEWSPAKDHEEPVGEFQNQIKVNDDISYQLGCFVKEANIDISCVSIVEMWIRDWKHWS